MICQQSEETEPDEDQILSYLSRAIASRALRVYSITLKCMNCAFYAVVYLYGHVPK